MTKAGKTTYWQVRGHRQVVYLGGVPRESECAPPPRETTLEVAGPGQPQELSGYRVPTRTVQKAPGGLPAAPVCAGWRAPSPGNAFPSCTRGFGLSFCAALGSVTQTRPSWSTFLEARCCWFRTTQSSHGDGPPWLQLTWRKIEWMGCGSPRVSATVTVGADLLPGKLGAPSGVFAL